MGSTALYSRLNDRVGSNGMKRNGRVAALLLLSLITGLGSGCSGSDGNRNPFSKESPASAKVEGVFYSAVDGLAVRDAASGSARTVGRLALHQKVTRSKVDRGFAHVKAGSLEGWVDNSKLVWKLPSASGKSPAAGKSAQPVAGNTEPQPGITTEQSSAPAVAPAVEDTAKDAAESAEQTAAPPPPPTTAPAKRGRSSASVFDPY